MTDVQRELADALGAQHSCDTLLTTPLCNRCKQSAGAVLPVVERLVAEAEARGRAAVVAKVEALAEECASMAAVLHDVRASDAFASVEIDLRALIVRESA